MKATVLAVAAAIVTGVAGEHHARRHAHGHLHHAQMEAKRSLVLTTAASPNATCGCTTIYSTFYGEPTLYFPPAPPAPVTSAPVSSAAAPTPITSEAPKPTPSTSEAPKPTTTKPAGPPVVPTSYVTVFPTPGTYTIPATTITLTATTVVPCAATTDIPAGPATAGGVTTVVLTETDVVCPYATTSVSEGAVTTVIQTTTHHCGTAGTCVIAPLTTSAPASTVWVYPVASTYAPGTYTQDAVTVTVTETNLLYVCPFTAQAPPAPVVATTKAPAPVAPVATPIVVIEAPVVVASIPSPEVVSPPKSTSSKPSGSKPPTGELQSTNDEPFGITYTPYTSDGACKSASDVMTDIEKISKGGFDVVRVYSSDCSALPNIGAACKLHGVKMILGVFIKSDGIAGAQQQVTDIVAWGQWDIVVMVIVGNEALMQGFCTPSELAGFISSCKSTFSSAGFNGPISTAEPLDQWQAHADILCPAIDVVGCNIHAFFNPDTPASAAGPFVKSQLDIADKLCAGKYAINTESGWPSSGTCNGKACPSPADQAVAIRSIKESCGVKSIVFSYQDDLWKEPGNFGCEQSWGIMKLFE